MKNLTVRQFVMIAAMAAVLETGKFALNAIQNVELVTLLTIIFTKRFGWKMTLPAVLVFALIENLWWGFGVWSIVYLFIWPFLVWITWIFRKNEDTLSWAVLSGLFGLLFGALCALATLIMAGWQAAVAWWIAGIPYDLVHGIANFIIALLLYRPLMTAMEHIKV